MALQNRENDVALSFTTVEKEDEDNINNVRILKSELLSDLTNPDYRQNPDSIIMWSNVRNGFDKYLLNRTSSGFGNPDFLVVPGFENPESMMFPGFGNPDFIVVPEFENPESMMFPGFGNPNFLVVPGFENPESMMFPGFGNLDFLVVPGFENPKIMMFPGFTNPVRAFIQFFELDIICCI